jgi:hypothetical protein
MYYLESDVKMVPGHIVYLDSGWAITSISQNQFWAKSVQSYGSGKVKGIVSAIISDWKKPGNGGRFGKPAESADNGEEIAREALAQIRAHLLKEPDVDFSESNVVGHYLDPAIVFEEGLLARITGVRPAIDYVRILRMYPRFRDVEENLEPLFINTAGSWLYRPREATDIDNLFLASDYVKTNTDLATMEGANESGRRAVNRILDFLNSRARRCRVFEFDEPMVFSPWKALDRHCFMLGLPHPFVSSVGNSHREPRPSRP